MDRAGKSAFGPRRSAIPAPRPRSARSSFPRRTAKSSNAICTSTASIDFPVNASASATPDYDVVVIGGALAGAATAILLRREAPQLRVLVVEKSETFGRRVGE